MKYSLAVIYDEDVLTADTEQRLQIKHEDGTSLLTGCGDCGSPWTDDREKLDEMIELANEAAAYRQLKADYWKGVGL